MTNSVDGLRFGVLKEQEFTFRSKLHSHQLSQVNSRSRAYSLPGSAVPVAPTPVAGLSNHNYRANNVSMNKPPPSLPPVTSQSRRRSGTFSSSVTSGSGASSSSTRYLSNTSNMSRRSSSFSCGSSAVGSTVQDPMHYSRVNNLLSQNLSSCDLPAIQEEDFPWCQQQQKLPPPSLHFHHHQQQKASFMSGDPHSDRLSEFIAKMVFVIFWQGSDSFLHVMACGGDFSRVDMVELFAANSCYPSADFLYYTKYLLETMQVSCSTALLSLFYLHRLRPRVKHLFVPGTFGDHAGGSSTSAAPGNKIQYRRDPKLEYRLFTVALILANKYLDDNSYSNKAWSDITGLDLKKINVMELEFMKYIQYTLLVKETEYVSWVRWLEAFIRVVMEQPAYIQAPPFPVYENNHIQQQNQIPQRPSGRIQRRYSTPAQLPAVNHYPPTFPNRSQADGLWKPQQQYPITPTSSDGAGYRQFDRHTMLDVSPSSPTAKFSAAPPPVCQLPTPNARNSYNHRKQSNPSYHYQQPPLNSHYQQR